MNRTVLAFKLIRWSLTGVVAATLLIPLLIAQAQQPGVPGFAEITSPSSGQQLDGLITIQGTADHPSFAGYELFFGYDPNPTNSWFPLTELIETPVQEDRLALWETDNLTPGTYMLKLVVHSEEGQQVEAVIHGLRLAVGPAMTEVSPASDPSLLDSSIIEEDTSLGNSIEPQVGEAQDLTQAPPTPTETLFRVLIIGALTALVTMLSFGLYSTLRPRVRDYAGLLKMRRIQQQQRRGDRPKKSQP